MITRAMEIIHRTGRTVAVNEPAEPEPARDLLADVAAVLDGNDRLRSADILHQLRARWESAYFGWSAQQFATALEDRGVEVKKRSLEGQPGQRVILAADIAAALDASSTESGRSSTGPS